MNCQAPVHSCLLQDDNIPGEGLEANTVFLHNGEGHVPGLAGLDVGYGARSSCVGAADNPATSAIFELVW